MSLRIFVVDDEAPARRKILRFLKTYPDIEIAGEARDGKEAVFAISKSNPDLVFLDVQMPGMDGFEVVEALAEVSELGCIDLGRDVEVRRLLLAVDHSSSDRLLHPRKHGGLLS